MDDQSFGLSDWSVRSSASHHRKIQVIHIFIGRSSKNHFGLTTPSSQTLTRLVNYRQNLATIEQFTASPSLSFWADILGILGFCFSVLTTLVSLSIKSEVSNIRRSVLFERRISDHIKKLDEHRVALNNYLIIFSQAQSKREIRNLLVNCKTELWNTIQKLTWRESWPVYRLIFRIWMDNGKRMVNRGAPSTTFEFYMKKYFYHLFEADKDRIFIIYSRLVAVTTHLENLKKDKKHRV